MTDAVEKLRERVEYAIRFKCAVIMTQDEGRALLAAVDSLARKDSKGARKGS